MSLKAALLLSDAAYGLGSGRFGFGLRPRELDARFASWQRYVRFKCRTLSLEPSGLCASKSVLLPSDAAYDLEFGRFGVSLRTFELEARFACWQG